MSLEQQQQQIPSALDQAPLMSADQILQSMSPGEAPVADPAPPPVFGGIPAEQFLGAAKEFFGAEFQSPEELRQRFQSAGQLPELQTKLQEMQSQLNQPKYYSPLSEAFDQKIREGVDPNTLKQFVELSLLEVDKLEPVDAIRRHYALTKPGFTQEERDALIARELGFDPTGEHDQLSALDTATLKERSSAAIEYLKQQQVSANNPAAVEAARQQQQLAANYTQVWNDVIPKLKPNTAFQFSVGEEKVGFEYQPSGEALEIARRAVQQEIQRNPLAYQPSQQNAEGLQKMMEQAVFLADLPRMLEALANHAYAEATKAAVARYSSNGAPINRQVGEPQIVPGQRVAQTTQQALYDML